MLLEIESDGTPWGTKLLLKPGLTTNTLENCMSIDWQMSAGKSNQANFSLVNVPIKANNVEGKFDLSSTGFYTKLEEKGKGEIKNLTEINLRIDTNGQTLSYITTITTPKSSYDAEFVCSFNTEEVDKPCEHTNGKYLSFVHYRCNDCNDIMPAAG